MRESGLGHCSGHSPNGARGLILRQHDSAMLANDAGASEAVVAHSGKDHGEGAGTVDAGDAAKQHIHRGPAMILGRVLIEMEAIPGARKRGCHYFHVPVSARDIDVSRLDQVCFRRFAYAQFAPLVQSLGE